MSATFTYEKIMVVDDSPLDLMIFERMIQATHFASSVILIETAQAALDYLRANPKDLPQLIFLDIDMPEMDGMRFLIEYGKLPINSRKKCIVFLTASIYEEDSDHALRNMYVLRYLTKPISIQALNNFKASLSKN